MVCLQAHWLSEKIFKMAADSKERKSLSKNLLKMKVIKFRALNRIRR
jgi:hypothetical protein